MSHKQGSFSQLPKVLQVQIIKKLSLGSIVSLLMRHQTNFLDSAITHVERRNREGISGY